MSNQARADSPYYRRDIDGLRAIAVLLVAFFHAGFALFKGGFIGVDIFFVISGFVVARAIQRGLGEGHFSFIGFYLGRAKRLAPALYVAMGCTFVFALLYLLPDDAMRTLKTLGYASLLSANVYLAHKTDYFASQTNNQPLLHIWSLSVEEQFYLILPAVLWLSWRWPARRRIGLFVVLAVVSLAASQWAASHATQGAYFLMPYRGFEFIAGVLLSFRRDPSRSGGADIGVLAGLVVALLSGVLLSASTPYPGWMALFPCVGAALLIGYGGASRVAGMLLGNRVMLFLGRISYSLYLWHWPVLFAFRRFELTSLPWTLLAIGLSIVLGYLSYRYVETPLRYARTPRRRVVLGYIAAPIAGAFALFFLGQVTDQFERLYPASFQQLYASAKQNTWENPRGRQCWNQVALTAAATCRLGATALPVNAALLGDSHAYHLIGFMDRLGNSYGLSIHDLAFPLCAPVVQAPKAQAANLQATQEKCAAHNRAAFDYVLANKQIGTVLLSANWEIYAHAPSTGTVNGFGFPSGAFADELSDTVAQLLHAGKHVVLFDDVPEAPERLTNCPLYNHMWLPPRGRDCSYPSTVADNGHRATAAALADIVKKYPQVGLVSMYDIPCTDSRCGTMLGDVPLYVANDYGHLNMVSSAHYYDAYLARHPGELQHILGSNPAAMSAAPTATPHATGS
ncbi:acyltransferase family protein [Dyella acidiphila]|uniref:Acyltransferase n=1 Tax=Dyella acidiphila TaxID=2775866 RepID=A0ABR9G4Q5_9GAMM|nr:acyltransferase family protein [Dyella acidiphila]MBE1158998.1 acyltransferase [Dyella acidiphila]